MKLIGLTGSFGTGKTTVALMLKKLGAKVYDADRIAHGLLRKGSSVCEKVVAAFGEDILDARKNIDRRKLGGLVFADKDSLKKLNRIIHPETIEIIKRRIAKARKSDVVVIDAPLLVEANLTGLVDKLIVVTASRENQIKRCIRKFRIKEEDVLRRIKSQIPIERKLEMADFIISNDGRKSETEKQVKKVWRILYGNS